MNKTNCPRCGRLATFKKKEWAPGYPLLRKHKDSKGKVCEVGYLRVSKVHGGWTES